MATGSRIVIDLTDATFIDSSILNAILASHKQFKGLGAIALVATPDGAPRRLLDLVHVGDFIRVFPIRELAIDALTHGPIRLTAPAELRRRQGCAADCLTTHPRPDFYPPRPVFSNG